MKPMSLTLLLPCCCHSICRWYRQTHLYQWYMWLELANVILECKILQGGKINNGGNWSWLKKLFYQVSSLHPFTFCVLLLAYPLGGIWAGMFSGRTGDCSAVLIKMFHIFVPLGCIFYTQFHTPFVMSMDVAVFGTWTNSSHIGFCIIIFCILYGSNIGLLVN